MPNQKSPYKKSLNIRISEIARDWLLKQAPGRFPSFSAYIDALIQKDKNQKGV